MRKIITIKSEFNSLESLSAYLSKEANYKSSIEYDSWEVRTDFDTGNMSKCVLVKKSGMHGLKAFFKDENTVSISYVIPSKILNAFFGKSQKSRRGIDEIVFGKIKEIALKGSQNKAFNEMEALFGKIRIDK